MNKQFEFVKLTTRNNINKKASILEAFNIVEQLRIG